MQGVVDHKRQLMYDPNGRKHQDLLIDNMQEIVNHKNAISNNEDGVWNHQNAIIENEQGIVNHKRMISNYQLEYKQALKAESDKLALRIERAIDNMKSVQQKFIDATLLQQKTVTDERKRFLDVLINKDKQHSLTIKDYI